MANPSTPAGFFEAPARPAGPAAFGASGQSLAGAAQGQADPTASVFAALIQVARQQPGDGPALVNLPTTANAPTVQSLPFGVPEEGLPDVGLHPGAQGLEQALGAVPFLAGNGGSQTGLAGTADQAAIEGADRIATDPADGDGTAPAVPSPEPPIIEEANEADEQASPGEVRAEAPPPGEAADTAISAAADEDAGGPRRDGSAETIADAAQAVTAPLDQPPAPIAGPESTPGAAARAVAWSLTPEQGPQGTPPYAVGRPADAPSLRQSQPANANAKGPAPAGTANGTGATPVDDGEPLLVRGDDADGPASQARSPVAEARNRQQFSQLLRSEFGERPGLPASSSPGTPESPVFASPAGSASPVVRAALQTSAGAIPTLPVRAIAVHIAQRFDSGERRFDIRLDPPELGRIEVRMEISRDGHVTAQLTADNPDTLDALQRDARGLERALQTAGLDTAKDGLSFQLREQASGRRDGDDRGGAPGRDDEEAFEETAPGHIVSLTAVDIRV